MPNFEKTESFTLSYQMDFDSFDLLEKLIKEIVKADTDTVIYYKVQLKNKVIINNLSLEELVELPNSGNSTIKVVTVSTLNNYDKPSTIYIRFSNKTKDSIEYILTTDNKKDFDYYQIELENYIKNLETLYSKITKSYMRLILVFAVMLFLLVFQISRYLVPFILTFPNEFIKYTSIAIWFILNATLGILSGNILYFTFPIGEFKLGAGKILAERRNWFRNGVLLSLLLPLVIPIFVKLFI